VEVLLAAAALPLPPPLAALLPDPTVQDVLTPADPTLRRLLALLPRADLYLQDEVHIAFHPTLTRVWCRRGRRGQRLVQAPGQNAKQVGFGLADWRDGWFDFALADKRAAAPFCAQLRRAVARSKARGRVALIVLDNLGIHTPRRSKLLRTLIEEEGEHLVLVYTPSYDPDSNRIEWLWDAFRAAVTHNHQRATFEDLLAAATAWATLLLPDALLRHIGSPYAPLPTDDLAEEQEETWLDAA
jgi:hypothetical protein